MDLNKAEEVVVTIVQLLFIKRKEMQFLWELVSVKNHCPSCGGGGTVDARNNKKQR